MTEPSKGAARGTIWPLVLDPGRAALPPFTSGLAIEAARLAEFISPALAAWLLQPAALRYGRRLVAADVARGSRHANHVARLRLMPWAKAIADSGIDAVLVDEFANAHALYPDHDLRPAARLDVVVGAEGVKPLIRLMGGHGFAAADGSDRNAITLVAPDGSASIAIRLGLVAGNGSDSCAGPAVVGASRQVAVDGTAMRVLSREHTLLLAAAAGAKARFGGFCVREVLDAAVLLRGGGALDWPAVRDMARAARLDGALRNLLALLAELGLERDGLPPKLIRPPRWPAAKGFRRIVDGYRGLFQTAGTERRA